MVQTKGEKKLTGSWATCWQTILFRSEKIGCSETTAVDVALAFARRWRERPHRHVSLTRDICAIDRWQAAHFITILIRENYLVGIGHDEFVQFGQIIRRDRWAYEMTNQNSETEVVIDKERIDRILRSLQRESKRRRSKESVTLLCSI